MTFHRPIVICLVAALTLPLSAFGKASAGNAGKNWDFRVFLDDKEIGYHRVRVVPDEDSERVTVEAKFDVKFLFISAFKYDHLTEEVWRDECLVDIRSETDSNGNKQFVRSRPADEGLQLVTHNGDSEITGCLRSVAYWAPERLQADRLLNSQTGDLQDAAIEKIGTNPIEIDGEYVEAVKYRLSIDDTDIDLWYTPDRHWLALKTVTKDGYELRYLPDRKPSR